MTHGFVEIEAAAQVPGASDPHALRLGTGEQHDDAALDGVLGAQIRNAIGRNGLSGPQLEPSELRRLVPSDGDPAKADPEMVGGHRVSRLVERGGDQPPLCRGMRPPEPLRASLSRLPVARHASGGALSADPDRIASHADFR